MSTDTKKDFYYALTVILMAFLVVLLFARRVEAQQPEGVSVDMSLIDGLELSPTNIFSYRLQKHGSETRNYLVKGSVIYRKQALSFQYEYRITLQPGITQVSPDIIGSPSWNFSSPALRELFQLYHKLPQGTYEYCVTLVPLSTSFDPIPEEPPSSCVYQTVDDLFLINLITPDNDAKIYEFNPMLGWVVNYPFASELSYRLRVAELKPGQNPQNAITRNNLMYLENNVMSTGVIYPLTARPLQKWQPYVWTVDAYYKGILLGGAEVWKFTIVDDSVNKALPRESFYIDIRNEVNNIRYDAVGRIKIKYLQNEKNEEELSFELKDAKGKPLNLKVKTYKAGLGDNRIDIDLESQLSLKHLGKYEWHVTNSLGEHFLIPFRYINPEFVK